MTTVQESPNGHLPQKGYPPAAKVYQQDELSPLDKDPLFAAHKVPPPCSVPDLQYEDGSEDSTRHDAGSKPSALGSNQLPERCQFFFSDGRQCRMERSDIHPSLCRFHAEREDQLFGDPAPGGNVVGAALDLPELHSACRDLSTATGVNRALGQVFRLLAQRRISRQEAATFGHLAQLLLRTIPLMRAESADPTKSSGESSDATSIAVPRNEPQGGTSSEPSPQHKNGAFRRQSAPMNVNSSAPPIAPAPCSEPLAARTAVKTSLGMNTCADFVCNSREINTSENAEFKAVQNEHLRKNGGGGASANENPGES